MKIETAVRASADTLTLTTVRPGDVYKRLASTYGSGDEAQLRFGVVEDVMSNGTDSGFTALEYVATYSAPTVELKTFHSGADLRIFPATPDEFRAHLDSLAQSADQAVRAAETNLTRALDMQRRVQALIAGAESLTAPETTTALTAV